MPAAQVSSLPPSPPVGEGWGEGEHIGSTQSQHTLSFELSLFGQRVIVNGLNANRKSPRFC